jgi:hypothetical protein
MNRLLAVAARELRERWLLFPGSLAFGFNPIVMPAFGVDRQVVPVVGVATAIGLGAAAAVVIGSTMLARDAANGRLGFLFSRPLSWPTIWGGKWLAAIVLVTGSAALAAIPFMATYTPQSHGGSWLRTLPDGPAWTFLLLLLVLAVGLANFNATAYRSRSPWVALDLVLLVAAVWAIRRYIAPLWLYGVLGKEDWTIALALLPLAIALVGGSVAQVAVGRTDLRRAHGALSFVFWTVIGLTLAGAAGYWQWIRSAGPPEVTVRALTHDPSGRWLYAEGFADRSGNYPHGLLVDGASGRWLSRPDSDPQPATVMLRYGASFSADGRWAALPGSDGRGTELFLIDLGGTTPRVTRVTLQSSPPPDWFTVFALSPNGRSVFVVHETGASIFALPSGRRVATTTIGPGWLPAALRFATEDSGRAWLSSTQESRRDMRVVDLATDGRTADHVFSPARAYDPGTWRRAVLPDATGRRLITLDGDAHLRDGATGALLATLADESNLSFSGIRVAAAFLADGRIVVCEVPLTPAAPAPGGLVLRVFDGAGAQLREVRLDAPSWRPTLGAEVAPGRILVSSFRSPALPEDTVVFDVNDGRVVERLAGLRPAIGFWAASADPGGAPQSVQYLRDADSRVIRLDFASGARTTVAGPDAEKGTRLRW